MYRYNNFRYSNSFNNEDRFFGGGFFGPFILGGITGGLIANSRPNNFHPVFVPFYSNPYQNQFNQFYYQNW